MFNFFKSKKQGEVVELHQPLFYPIDVFCRIRPPVNSGDVHCITVPNEKQVLLSLPETSFQSGPTKATLHTFKHVFDNMANQKIVFEKVACPLVQQYIQGYNSLLATYGVTNSGKSYTMTGGQMEEEGLIPRTLREIFEAVRDVQTPACMISPDQRNGFEVLSEEAAEKKSKKTRAVQNGLEFTSNGITAGLEKKFGYSVFVSFFEVYNNLIYDLLEDGRIPNTKNLREDVHHNVYVQGVIQVEVKSFEAAMALFKKGQKRRRVGATILNSVSSRSHSLFDLRLVKVPLLPSQNGKIVIDGSAISITHMSLVDLAGSERTERTNNTGNRLKESGNINNSLMTLRACLEVMRENQSQGENKLIPYRDSRLTQYLRNFFKGMAKIGLIVCVSPSLEDFYENSHVLQFAEVTQEVQIPRSTPVAPKMVTCNENGHENAEAFNMENAAVKEALPEDFSLVYLLDAELPTLDIDDPRDISKLTEIEMFLENRLKARSAAIKVQYGRQNSFRRKLVKMEEDNALLKKENEQLKQNVATCECKIVKLERELWEKDRLLRKHHLESERRDAKVCLLSNVDEEWQASGTYQRIEQRGNVKLKMKTEWKCPAVKPSAQLNVNRIPSIKVKKATSESEVSTTSFQDTCVVDKEHFYKKWFRRRSKSCNDVHA